VPYSVRKSGEKFNVVNKETGDVKGTHASRAKAQKQVNLLRGVKHGWTPTKGKK